MFVLVQIFLQSNGQIFCWLYFTPRTKEGDSKKIHEANAIQNTKQVR